MGRPLVWWGMGYPEDAQMSSCTRERLLEYLIPGGGRGFWRP